MPHILITDDDPHLRRLVRTYALVVAVLSLVCGVILALLF